MKLVNKRFVESKEAPNNTNVYWIDYDETNKGKILDIKEYINGNWRSVLNVNSPEFTIDISQITGLGKEWIETLKANLSFRVTDINGYYHKFLILEGNPPDYFWIWAPERNNGGEGAVLTCINSKDKDWDSPGSPVWSDRLTVTNSSVTTSVPLVVNSGGTSSLGGTYLTIGDSTIYPRGSYLGYRWKESESSSYEEEAIALVKGTRAQFGLGTFVINGETYVLPVNNLNSYLYKELYTVPKVERNNRDNLTLQVNKNTQDIVWVKEEDSFFVSKNEVNILSQDLIFRVPESPRNAFAIRYDTDVTELPFITTCSGLYYDMNSVYSPLISMNISEDGLSSSIEIGGKVERSSWTIYAPVNFNTSEYITRTTQAHSSTTYKVIDVPVIENTDNIASRANIKDALQNNLSGKVIIDNELYTINWASVDLDNIQTRDIECYNYRKYFNGTEEVVEVLSKVVISYDAEQGEFIITKSPYTKE